MQGSGDQIIVLVVMSNGQCGPHFYGYKGKKTLSSLFFHLPYLPPILEVSNPNYPCLKTVAVATATVAAHTPLIRGASPVHG
jgi:hypothetical protein